MKNFVFNDLENSKIEVFCLLKKLLDADSFLTRQKTSILELTELQAYKKCNFSSKEQEIIYNLIIDNCFFAEQLAPGSFIECIRNLLSSEFEFEENLPFYPDSESLKKLLFQSIQQKDLRSLVENAVQLAGYRGKISIEKSSNLNSSIEAKNSYTFNCKTFEKKSFKLENIRAICIDGYIESVAELNRLFLELAEKKQQLVIFSAGFHDEVLATIEINKKRGTMFVVPVVVPFDIENVNSLVDISIVTGAQLVSSNLGRIISTVDISDSSIVDEIDVFHDRVSIKNEKTMNATNIHVKNILDRISTSSATELCENRIKRLSCNTVVIRLPDDKDFVNKSQQIDSFLRSFKSMINFGVCDENSLFAKKAVAAKFAKKIILQLENLGSIVYRENLRSNNESYNSTNE